MNAALPFAIALGLGLAGCGKKPSQRAAADSVSLLELFPSAQIEAVTFDLGENPGRPQSFALPWVGATEMALRIFAVPTAGATHEVAIEVNQVPLRSFVTPENHVVTHRAGFQARPGTNWLLAMPVAKPNAAPQRFSWDAIRFLPAGGNRPRVEGERLVLPAGTGLMYHVRLAPGALEWSEDSGNRTEGLTVVVKRARTLDVVQRVQGVAGTRIALDGAGGEMGVLILRASGSQPVVLSRPRLRTGPAGDRPNIILYVVDTFRRDHASLYGYHRPTTRQLEAFARDGLVFDNAFAQSSWTRPTVVSILTGIETPNHGVLYRPSIVPPSFALMPEILHQAGYRTAAFVTNGNVNPRFGMDQGFEDFVFFPPDEDSEHVHPLAADLHERALAWLGERARQPERPFFAYVHAMDPHGPYTTGGRFRKEFAGDDIDPKLGDVDAVRALGPRAARDPRIVEKIIGIYDAEIAGWDEAFGLFVAELKKLGLYDNTLIILVADHGENMFEHGRGGHAVSVYPQEIRIPLVVKPRASDRVAPARVAANANQIDILPTVLGEIGVDHRAYAGASLFELARQPRQRPMFASQTHAKNRHDGIWAAPWMLILRRTHDRPNPLLCRIDRDPGCVDNLADAHPAEVERLTRLIEAHHAEGAMQPSVTRPLSGEQIRQLEKLGYVGD